MMPKINQELIERLKKKLGVGQAAVYDQIKKAGLQQRIARRDLAALALAWQHGISIQKYANSEQLDRLAALTGNAPAIPPSPAALSSSQNSRKTKSPKVRKAKGDSVFVVHGRDEELRKSMFSFLRALGLNPMEWEHAVAAAKGGNPYIGEILEAAMSKVQAVVVLLSPDEEARLKEQFWGTEDHKGDGQLQGQPRPNVLFEAGLALGAHPEKTVLVHVGKMRAFSDIAGKHLVRLTNDVPKRNELANRLAKLGCVVNRVGSDWMTIGNFVPTENSEVRLRKSKK